MRIQHNIMAMNAYRNYTNNVASMKKNLEKLSSGYKINRAGDDAAGLAISEKMRAQITGLKTAQKNAKDGISLVQTAEGALTEVHSMLNRMVELASQSANGTYDNDVDRYQMQKEVNQLLSEIDRIADSSNFNGINLLDGTLGLNTTAFEIVGATEFKAGVVASGAVSLATQTDTVSVANRKANTILHETGNEAQAGEFSIDLSQLTALSTQAGKKLNVKIGTVTFSSIGAALSAGKTYTGQEIATIVKDYFTGSAASKALMVKADGTLAKYATAAAGNTGAIAYKAISASNGVVKFQAFTISKGTGGADTLTNGVATSNLGSQANAAPAWEVALSGANVKYGDGAGVNHNNIWTTPISKPEAPGADQLASTILTLDGTKIKDGSVLNFNGKDYTFAIGSNSTVDKTGANVIDLTAYTAGKTDIAAASITDTDDQEQIMTIIANTLNAGDTDFSVGNDVNGTAGDYLKLSVFERANATTGKSAASTATQKKLETENGFKSLFKVTDAATNAGTEVKITNANVKEGNTLTIDGKKYVFTTEDKTNTDDVTYVKFTKDGSDAQTNLITALNNNSVKTGTSDAGNLVIYGTGKTAPTVLGKGLTLQIGDTSDDFNQLNVSVQDMHSGSIGVGKLDISTEEAAQAAVDKIKAAINTVSDVRGTLGATQNRLDHTINNLSVMTENIQDAESTIRDTDVAEEMMAYTKNNILIQSAQAMLAQANQVPQGVLQLLQ